MKKILSPLLLFYFICTGCSLKNTLVHADTTKRQKIKILDEKSLFPIQITEFPFSEISDLSYNPENHKLYMIGDKGYLYTSKIQLSNTIGEIEYLKAVKIKEKKYHKYYDIEGLTQNSKKELVLSFERQPRIANITASGLIGKNYLLPKGLQEKKNFVNGNKIFEALAWHPKYGLLTVAEYPIKKQKRDIQTLYSLKGKEWHFKTEAYSNSAVTAIEVMDDKHILILERAFTKINTPMYITLKKLSLDKCNREKLCQTETLASFQGIIGFGVHNFEGLTKVSKNRYLMVSDNNNKSMLPTKLIYFEVLP